MSGAVGRGSRPLPGRWVDLARDGDSEDSYSTAYAAAMGLMCAAARRNLSWQDVEPILLGWRLFSDAYQTRDDGGRRNLRASLVKARADWDSAVRHVAENPPITDKRHALFFVGEVQGEALTRTWSGRNALRDLTVLTVLLTVATSTGSITPTISIRTLCEDTPYKSFRTISAALTSLEEAGWLKRSRVGCTADQPTAYELRIPKVSDLVTDCTALALRGERPSVVHSVTRSSTDAGVKLALALTPHAQAVYAGVQHLTENPPSPGRASFTPSEVAAAAGVSRGTAYKWLPRLAIIGLIRLAESRWTLTDLDPKRVAVEQGAPGHERKRSVKHATQRAGWRAWHDGRRVALDAEEERVGEIRAHRRRRKRALVPKQRRGGR